VERLRCLAKGFALATCRDAAAPPIAPTEVKSLHHLQRAIKKI